jgi:hypothetical protein
MNNVCVTTTYCALVVVMDNGELLAHAHTHTDSHRQTPDNNRSVFGVHETTNLRCEGANICLFLRKIKQVFNTNANTNDTKRCRSGTFE